MAVTGRGRRALTILSTLLSIVALPLFLAPGPAVADVPADAKRSFILRQQFEAEVSEFEAAGKKLRLKTGAGRLTLDGRNTATTAFKKGEWVLVDVTLVRHADPAKLPRSDEAPRSELTQHLRASIIGIQRSLGVVTLNTPAGRLALELPSAAVASLRTGDPMFLELRVVAEPDVSAFPATKSDRSKKGFGALLLMIFGRDK